MILYCAADLLWASKIKGTADALGIPCRPVRTMEMLTARLADSPVKAIMVDLEAGEVGLEMIRALKGRVDNAAVPVKVLVFGPHVDVDGFARAKESGADVTMTRGGLQGRMEEVLKGLAGAGE